MTKEDLSPEQLEAFDAAMKESKRNIINIGVSHVLILILLQTLNFFICKNFLTDQGLYFVVCFLSTMLVISSGRKAFEEEADRFTEESQKIFDNK